jgi:alkaline phosphatase D
MRRSTGLPRVLCVLVLLPGDAARAQEPEPTLSHGPLLGHVDAQSIHVWARAAAAGTYTLHLQDVGGDEATTCTAEASAAGDFTLHFRATGLAAGTAHDFWITRGERIVHPRGGAPLVTSMPDDASEATIAFGSCANDLLFREQPIWGRILARAPHALVLLGDTPYVDDGTVEGRRRRQRAFFAFPPVRAALAAIPTWTTWDDHDYATNDLFGAVTGSETARGVFVDYHAHAGYGDGERGIHTSFRRGPIEVFLLDARSFADTEPSVLAPGERSLLGRTQTEWLQRGLRASTATFRVLACGMVWNGAVRPDKKDCWGNWLPERDALLRWIGEQRIPGVVLVSGDVHRSRVILHPVLALAGYDVPEFVTSPLAQGVIETNAVPAPGLEFDAGEPHSCLFLTATRRNGAATLRAVFQSGDGREFHVREFALADLTKPDAAAHYRRVAAELRRAFGSDCERLPDADPAPGGLPVSEAEAGRGDWRQAVAAAQPAFAAWEEAAGEERCRFSPASRETSASEFVPDLLLPITKLEQLAAAKGLQAVADRDHGGVVRVVRSLLALARHLHQEAGCIAWGVAADAEQLAVALAGRATAVSNEAAAPLQEAFRRHLARRLPLAAAAAALRAETMRLFDVVVPGLRLEDDARGTTARRYGREVRQHFVDLLEPCFAAFAALPDAPTSAQRDELRLRIDLLAQRWRDAAERLRALDGKAAPGQDAASDLALLLARLLGPDLVAVVEQQTRALAALQTAAR